MGICYKTVALNRHLVEWVPGTMPSPDFQNALVECLNAHIHGISVEDEHTLIGEVPREAPKVGICDPSELDARFRRRESIELEFSPDLVKNADRSWRSKAEAEYNLRTRFFADFRHRTSSENSKNWVEKRLGLLELMKRTVNGPAKFNYRYPEDKLDAALYDAVRFNWRNIAENRPSALYVRFKPIIGAASGKASTLVKFYLDYSTAEVHSRPILESDKPPNERWLDEIPFEIWNNMTLFDFPPTIDEPLEFGI